jgi:hypothetical protein
MDQPEARTAEERAFEARKIAAERCALERYPEVRWVSTTEELRAANKFTRELVLPANVKLARARLPRNKQESEVLAKELRQSKILSDLGNVIYLTPEPGAYKKRAMDALVNGIPFEFRNVAGKPRQIEELFSDAKNKGREHSGAASAINVFLTIESYISRHEARHRIDMVLARHPDDTGSIIVSFADGRTYFWDTSGFRQ